MTSTPAVRTAVHALLLSAAAVAAYLVLSLFDGPAQADAGGLGLVPGGVDRPTDAPRDGLRLVPRGYDRPAVTLPDRTTDARRGGHPPATTKAAGDGYGLVGDLLGATGTPERAGDSSSDGARGRGGDGSSDGAPDRTGGSRPDSPSDRADKAPGGTEGGGEPDVVASTATPATEDATGDPSATDSTLTTATSDAPAPASDIPFALNKAPWLVTAVPLEPVVRPAGSAEQVRAVSLEPVDSIGRGDAPPEPVVGLAGAAGLVGTTPFAPVVELGEELVAAVPLDPVGFVAAVSLAPVARLSGALGLVAAVPLEPVVGLVGAVSPEPVVRLVESVGLVAAAPLEPILRLVEATGGAGGPVQSVVAEIVGEMGQQAWPVLPDDHGVVPVEQDAPPPAVPRVPSAPAAAPAPQTAVLVLVAPAPAGGKSIVGPRVEGAGGVGELPRRGTAATRALVEGGAPPTPGSGFGGCVPTGCAHTTDVITGGGHPLVLPAVLAVRPEARGRLVALPAGPPFAGRLPGVVPLPG